MATSFAFDKAYGFQLLAPTIWQILSEWAASYAADDRDCTERWEDRHSRG